jgi:hypothetical protein
MNKEETRDLRWWHVPAWAHATPRFIVTWLATCLVVGLGTGLVTGFGDLEFFPGDLVVGFVVGLVLGLVPGYVFGRGDKIPKRIAPVRWRQLFRRTPLMVGLLAALLTGPWVGPGIGAGIGAGLVAWLGAGLVAGMSRPGTDSTSPLSPLASWRSDRAFGLMTGLVTGLVTWFVLGLVFAFIEWRNGGAGPGHALLRAFLPALGVGLMAGLGVGIAYPQWVQLA